jgi:hypothetical protein
MKKITTLFTLFFCFIINAQVPSYVPTDGLVAYYPFNGNATMKVVMEIMALLMGLL